jgi:glycosyltransferase involved in cell wall biosynthesis
VNEVLKILVVSHSTANGGAETALKNVLIALLSLDHKIYMLVPSNTGPLIDWCLSRGIKCFFVPMTACRGAETVTSVLQIAPQNFDVICSQMSEHQIDLILTNTSVIPHGMQMAKYLKCPHITYVHEWVGDDSDCNPAGLAWQTYFKLVLDQSQYTLCCSEAVKVALKALRPDAPVEVLHPYLQQESVLCQSTDSGSEEVSLLFIGARSIRKNPVFAIFVLRGLLALNYKVRLLFIGGDNTESNRLRLAIQRYGLDAYIDMHGSLDYPYEIVRGKCINVISSIAEPFGLTIPESLVRGIPVVAARSGGPDHLLDAQCLFDINDLDGCIHAVEKIIHNYPLASATARQCYDGMEHHFLPSTYRAILTNAIVGAMQRGPNLNTSGIDQLAGLHRAIKMEGLTSQMLLESFAKVSGLEFDLVAHAAQEINKRPQVSYPLTRQMVCNVQENARSTSDLEKVREMNLALYATVRTLTDEDTSVAGFILLKLLDERKGGELKILILDDTVGVQAIRLASLGFDVHCVYMQGLFSQQVAAENIFHCNYAIQLGKGNIAQLEQVPEHSNYDVAICLNSLRLAQNLHKNMALIASYVKENGLLLIAESFDAMNTYTSGQTTPSMSFSGLLSLVASDLQLTIEGFNESPLCQPTALRKNTVDTTVTNASTVASQRVLAYALLSAQIQIGI